MAVARWHADRPQLLARTVAGTISDSPTTAPFAERILARLPRRVLASQNLRTATTAVFSSMLPLDAAATCPWINFDSETHRNVLGFDLDHADGLDLIEDLPPHIRPWLVIDQWSGSAHAFLHLASPVSMGPGSSAKARRLADVAQAMVASALRATPLRHRALLKNPLGRADALLGPHLRRTPQPTMPAMWDAWQASGSPLLWHTIPGTGSIELRAIVAALADDHGEAAATETTRRRFRRRFGSPSALGRNCTLFDLVRWWAYDRVEFDAGAILAEARRVNRTFAMPLPAAEVAATARSIAKFMRTRYRPRTGAASTRGRDREAGAGMETREERQALAGRVTAAARAAATAAKIDAAITSLRAAGKVLSRAAIAAEAGVSPSTMKRHWPAARDRDWNRMVGGSYAVLSGSEPGPSSLSAMKEASAEEAAGVRDEVEAGKHKVALARKPRKQPHNEQRQRHFLLPLVWRQDQRPDARIAAREVEERCGPPAKPPQIEARPPPVQSAA